MTQPEPFLRVHDLHASFVQEQGNLTALAGISFTAHQGEFVCIIGPSGCGKSTLLRIVAGLLPASRGNVTLHGRPQQQPGRQVGLVFQQPTLLPWRTVWGNVALPLETAGVSQTLITRQVRDLLALVGLSGFEEAYPAQLSGGMAQRAAIARALAQLPELLLLDEPFGALDALTREYMAGELLRIWEQQRCTVLMVTHNVDEAALLADRVIVMSHRPGRISHILESPLPRPRPLTLLKDERLKQFAATLREALALPVV